MNACIHKICSSLFHSSHWFSMWHRIVFEELFTLTTWTFLFSMLHCCATRRIVCGASKLKIWLGVGIPDG